MNQSPGEITPVSLKTQRHDDSTWTSFFDHSPVSTQAFSPSGQTIRFNRAWSRLFGYTDEEAYQFNVLTDPALVASGATTLIAKAFQGEIVTIPPLPFPVRGRETPIRWIGGTLYPVKNPDGSIKEVTVVHHDVTELKEAEDLIRALLEAKDSTNQAALKMEEALRNLENYHPVRKLPDFNDHRPLLTLGLTQKEAQVLLWVAQGKSNSETATILGVAESTVKKHLEHIFEKLGVEKRGAASLIAIEALTP